MTCEQLQDLLPLYAVGGPNGLDAGELRELRAHLATGCPVCSGALAEFQAAAAQMPLALEPVEPSAATRGRTLARISLGPAASKFVRARVDWSHWAMAAGFLVAFLSAFILYQMMRGAERREQAQADWAKASQEITNKAVVQLLTVNLKLARLQDQVSSLDARYQQLSKDAEFTVNMLKYPQWKIATVESKDPAHPQEFGRICYDTQTGTTHFFAMNMQPAGPGKTYQLWLITKDNKKVSVGTFDVKDAQGEVVNLKVPMPADAGPVMIAAVTDEPAGGVPQPTGTIHMAGQLEDIH